MISQSNLLYFKNLQFIYLIGSLCGQNIILSTSIFFLNIYLSSPIEKIREKMKTDLNALFLEAFCTNLTFYLRRIIIR